MEYRVLARKYRPATFSDLVGQEALVQTLSNAIKSGRVAHAFLLTGIRGIGKTTTARIIARALNCIGADGQGGATIDPCGVCANCTQIAEDRHPDVLEMDAASHTGVNDIRDLIETVRYLPTSARNKIYIIDEVHMLSNSAFNALLKTLEEPPPHVKFIFATTESRKIPVTILSRCQRFDLQRLSTEKLASHLGNIAFKENITLEAEALSLLAIGSEGSVRDGLSLLDRAIAYGATNANQVREMLGLADRSQTIELLKYILSGDCVGALTHFRMLHEKGADPLLLLQDALELTHFITRVKLVPAAGKDLGFSENEREAAKALAASLSMPVLTRLWQMLLKGLSEIRLAPSPVAAAEMILARIAYAGTLPTPSEILKNGSGGMDMRHPGVGRDPGLSAPQNIVPKELSPLQSSQQESLDPGLRRDDEKLRAEFKSQEVPVSFSPMPKDFTEVVKLFELKREPLLASQLRQFAAPVSFSPGALEVRMKAVISRDFTPRVAQCLTEWTGQEWKVLLSEKEGEATLQEQTDTQKAQDKQAALTHPIVASVLEHFPGAEVVDVV